jgi:CrcB protein
VNDSRTIALVAVGGAAGALLRYAAGEVATTSPGTFPATTLTINVAGAFALGLLLAGLTRQPARAATLRPLLGIGVLGSFTTYSTFSVETVELWRGDAIGLAITYVVVSLVAGLVAASLGLRLGGTRAPAVADGES